MQVGRWTSAQEAGASGVDEATQLRVLVQRSVRGCVPRCLHTTQGTAWHSVDTPVWHC